MQIHAPILRTNGTASLPLSGRQQGKIKLNEYDIKNRCANPENTEAAAQILGLEESPPLL